MTDYHTFVLKLMIFPFEDHKTKGIIATRSIDRRNIPLPYPGKPAPKLQVFNQKENIYETLSKGST